MASAVEDKHVTAIYTGGTLHTTTMVSTFGELLCAVDDEGDVFRAKPYIQLQPSYAKDGK